MACNTDQLSDTADYHSIVEEIRKLVSDRSYKLLERLAFEVYSTIRAELLPIRAGIRVKVTKLKPPVQGIEGGVSFSYGDFEP
jgi:dihydroneopterin aldolase